MTTEQAIILLSKRAEYALQKADTPDKREKAAGYADIVNTIIDHYNRTEHLQDDLRRLEDIVQVLCEYIGIRQADTDYIKQMPAVFLRNRLIYRLPESGSISFMFHKISTDYILSESSRRLLQELSTVILPMAERCGAGIDIIKALQQQLIDESMFIERLQEPENT